MRVVRFYVSCRRPPSPPPPPPPPPDLNRKCRMAVFPAGRRTLTTSSGWPCSPLDLNRQLRLPVFPVGPPPRAPTGSVPRREPRASAGSVPRQTSTASFGWQRSPPDLNRELRRAVFLVGPQPRASAGSVPRQTSTTSFGWERSPPDFNRKSEDMPGTVESQKECQDICRRYARNKDPERMSI